jgi:hypothetical protein
VFCQFDEVLKNGILFRGTFSKVDELQETKKVFLLRLTLFQFNIGECSLRKFNLV